MNLPLTHFNFYHLSPRSFPKGPSHQDNIQQLEHGGAQPCLEDRLRIHSHFRMLYSDVIQHGLPASASHGTNR